MYTDSGGVDHHDSGKCFYDAALDTSPPPADKAVVASGVWANRRGQIRPVCRSPEEPRGLFGSIGLMMVHSWSASS